VAFVNVPLIVADDIANNIVELPFSNKYCNIRWNMVPLYLFLIFISGVFRVSEVSKYNQVSKKVSLTLTTQQSNRYRDITNYRKFQ